MNLPIETAVAFLLVLYPTLLLVVRNGTSVCFVLLVVLAILHSARTTRLKFDAEIEPPMGLYALAMASFCVATLFSQAYHGKLTLVSYDGPSRFLLAVPIYAMLRRMPLGRLTVVQFGFVGGAVAAAIVAVLSPPHGAGRIGTYFLDSIHFGDLALLLGALAALSIGWSGTDSWPVIGLKIAAGLGGAAASVSSGSRGGWAAVPFVFALWWRLDGRVSRRAKMLGALAAIGAALALYVLPTPVHLRVNELISNLSVLPHDEDTSVGLRLQIWSAALHLFAQNPVFGVGPDQFGTAAQKLVAEGYLTPKGAELAAAEVHNEILTRAVTLGLFGLIAIVAIFLVPFGLFVRSCRDHDGVRRVAGVLGACFVAAFLLCGMTVEVFDLKTPATFYSLTVAVLLAISTRYGPAGERSVG